MNGFRAYVEEMVNQHDFQQLTTTVADQGDVTQVPRNKDFQGLIDSVASKTDVTQLRSDIDKARSSISQKITICRPQIVRFMVPAFVMGVVVGALVANIAANK